MTRIGLIGGHPYERNLLAEWLRAVPGVQSVTGIVADDPRRNGRPPVDLAVVIVDEDGDDPVAACREVAGLDTDGVVVAVLRTGSAPLIERLAVAGADGMVSMASGPKVLGHAVDRVRNRAVWLDPALSPFVIQGLGGVPDNGLGLTRRELDIARYLPEGLSRCEIADELGVSEETVKTHIRSIYSKLDVTDRVAAARAITTHLNGGNGRQNGHGRRPVQAG